MREDNDLCDAISGIVVCAILMALIIMLVGCASNPRPPESVKTYPGIPLINKKF